MFEVKSLGLGRVCEISPKRFADDRGFFMETYNREKFLDAGIHEKFIQDNHSKSVKMGTLRGLHFQSEPKAQAKIVRVIKGSIFDVAVDIRENSKDFGKWVALTLTSQKANQIFVPAGFAHGFLTLEDDTEVCYKVDNSYSRIHDKSIRYDDPLFKIEWPKIDAKIVLSDKDKNSSNFRDL